MSIHSIDDYEPSSSTPVFGSTVSQTKLQQQQQPVNDLGGSEKLVTPPQPIVNGQNEAVNATSDVNSANNTNQSTNENGTTTETNVNAQNGSSTIEQVSTTSDSLQPKSSNELVSNPPEPELISPAPVHVPDNAPSVDAPAETQVPTSTSSNENVSASATAPEATVLADSSKPARQTKSPRGKAKAPVVVAAPTRQSTRARKPVAINADDSNNEDEQEQPATTTTPKRGKRQPKTTTTTTTTTTITAEAPAEEPAVQSAQTPSPRKGAKNAGKKRAASPSPSASASKKAKTTPKGKQSAPEANTEQESEVKKSEDTPTKTAEPESVEKTPAKKARTSANRKTPTATTTTPESTGDYVRKLRPRK